MNLRAWYRGTAQPEKTKGHLVELLGLSGRHAEASDNPQEALIFKHELQI